LLRVLQEREIEPLGSDKVTKVDVRVIAATNVDLHKRVSEGTFRADLYYRLNVLSIVLPPLRQCLDDLPEICGRLLEDISASGDYLNARI
uniref:sigma 54-interacting transcriptional regulator n=2 Tax=Pseudomonadota TaxID=1224 RepID=UPI0019541FD1